MTFSKTASALAAAERFSRKSVCLRSLTMSSCCCVCSPSLYTVPSNSEKWGTVWLHLQDLFCIRNCPGCMYKIGPTALESSARRLSGFLKGRGGLKTTLLPESFAPVIAIRNSSHHPGRPANTESAHVRLWWVNRWFSSLICPYLLVFHHAQLRAIMQLGLGGFIQRGAKHRDTALCLPSTPTPQTSRELCTCQG